jgi:hypothetical protein
MDNPEQMELQLRRSRRHVADAERRLGLQQIKVRCLAAGSSTEDSLVTALRLLHLYQKTILVMQQHVSTEEEIVASLLKRRASNDTESDDG